MNELPGIKTKQFDLNRSPVRVSVEDIDISNMSLDSIDLKFNIVIGHIETIIMDQKFLDLHNQFMEEFWKEFEYGEENKFVYTDIFKKYNETIEKYIEEQLQLIVADFDMNLFEKELITRQNDLEGEIFEILSTFSDFIAFKAMFLDYKAMKEGTSIDFSQDILVSKYEVTNIS